MLSLFILRLCQNYLNFLIKIKEDKDIIPFFGIVDNNRNLVYNGWL